MASLDPTARAKIEEFISANYDEIMMRAQQKLIQSMDAEPHVRKQIRESYQRLVDFKKSTSYVPPKPQKPKATPKPKRSIDYDNSFDKAYLPKNEAPKRDGPRESRCFAGPPETLYNFNLQLTPVPHGVTFQEYHSYMDRRPMTRFYPQLDESRPITPKSHVVPMSEGILISPVSSSEESEMESDESEEVEISSDGPKLEKFTSESDIEVKSASSVASDDLKGDPNSDSDKENVENMEM